MRLRQVRRCPVQDLVLLLQQPDPLACLTQLGRLAPTHAGLDTGVDIGLTQPLEQRHRVHTEVLGDLLDPSHQHHGCGQPARRRHGTHEDRAWAQRHPSGRPQGKPSQMSPIGAADPIDVDHFWLDRRALPCRQYASTYRFGCDLCDSNRHSNHPARQRLSMHVAGCSHDITFRNSR
jgi:hypothetical protein